MVRLHLDWCHLLRVLAVPRAFFLPILATCMVIYNISVVILFSNRLLGIHLNQPDLIIENTSTNVKRVSCPCKAKRKRHTTLRLPSLMCRVNLGSSIARWGSGKPQTYTYKRKGPLAAGGRRGKRGSR